MSNEQCELCGGFLHEGVCQNPECPPDYDLPGMSEELDFEPQISRDADFTGDDMPMLSSEADSWPRERRQAEPDEPGESDTWRDPNWLSASFLSIEQAAQPIDHTGTVLFEGEVVENYTAQEPRDHIDQTRLTDDESYKLIRTILRDSVTDDDFTIIEGKDATDSGAAKHATDRPNISQTIRLHNPLLSHGTEEAVSGAKEKAKATPSLDSKNYKIIRVIGEGGSGVVFEALQLTLNRRVAVKVLKQRKQKSGSRSRVTTKEIEKRKSRFLHEVNVTAKLQHPNIIPVFDLEIDKEGEVFYSMRLVDEKAGSEVQQSWAVLLRGRKGDFSSETIERDVQIFGKVCDAIRFAHSENIIHRDLKPDNVMVGNFGEVLVIDWGMSLDLSEGPQYFSAGGTTTYMAPEMGQHYLKQTEVHLSTQELFVKLDESRRDEFIEGALDHSNYYAAAGLLQDDTLSEEIHALCRDLIQLSEAEMALAKQINPKSDIYLLGAILYEIAVGHPPHYVPLSTCRNVNEKHHREFWLSSNHKIQRLVQIDDPLRLSLCNIALRALQKNPDDRFTSIDELKDALKEFANQVQSMRLVAKGRTELEKAQGSEGYMHLLPALESFRGAETLYSLSQDAKQLRVETACEYARRADRRKDFDAGLSILEEYAPGVDQNNVKVVALADRLHAGKRKLARNRRLAAVGWATAIVLPIIVWGASWLRSTQLRKDNQELVVKNDQLSKEQVSIVAERVETERTLKEKETQLQKTTGELQTLDMRLASQGEQLEKIENDLQTSQVELVEKANKLSEVATKLTDTTSMLDEKTVELSVARQNVRAVEDQLEQLRFASAEGQFSSFILPIPLDLRRGQLDIAKRRLDLLKQSSLPAMLKNVWIAGHFAKFVSVPGREARIGDSSAIFKLLPWTNDNLIALANENGKLQLWSANGLSGKSTSFDAELPEFGVVSDATVSSDGRWLALAIDNVVEGAKFGESIWLVNLETGKRVGIPDESTHNQSAVGCRSVRFLPATSGGELNLISVEELTSYRGLKKRLQVTCRQYQISENGLSEVLMLTYPIAATTRDDGRVDYLVDMDMAAATPTIVMAYRTLDDAGRDRTVLESCRLGNAESFASDKQLRFVHQSATLPQMPISLAVASTQDIYCGFTDGHVDHFGVDSLGIELVHSLTEHESPVIALSAARGGRVIAASADGVMILLERDMQMIKRLVGQPDKLTSILVYEAASKNIEANDDQYAGFHLASGGANGTIRFWEPEGSVHDATIQKFADRASPNEVRLTGDTTVTSGAIDQSRNAGSIPSTAFGTLDGRVLYFDSTAMQSQKGFREIAQDGSTKPYGLTVAPPPGFFDSSFDNFDSIGLVDDWFVLLQSDGNLYSAKINSRSKEPSSQVELTDATQGQAVISRFVPLLATAPNQQFFFSNNPVDDQELLVWQRSAGKDQFEAHQVLLQSGEKGRIKKMRFSPDGRWLAIVREVGQSNATGQYVAELLGVERSQAGDAILTTSAVTSSYRVGDPAFVEFSNNSKELIFHFHKLGVDRETWYERWLFENDRWLADEEKRRLDDRLVNLVAWDGDQTLVTKINRQFFLTNVNGREPKSRQVLQFKDRDNSIRRVHSVQPIGSSGSQYVLFNQSLERFDNASGMVSPASKLEFDNAREVRTFGDRAIVYDNRGFHLVDSDLNYVTLIARNQVAVQSLDLAGNRMAVSYDIGGLCKVFDVSADPIRELGRFDQASHVRLSPDGLWASCRRENDLYIYSVSGSFKEPRWVQPITANNWVAHWISGETPRLLVAKQTGDERGVSWKEIDPQVGNFEDSKLRLPIELGAAGSLSDFRLSAQTQKYLAITTLDSSASSNAVELWAIADDADPKRLSESEGFKETSFNPISVSFSEILQSDKSSIGTQMNVLSRRAESSGALGVSSKSFVFVDQKVHEEGEDQAPLKHLYQVFEIEGVIDVVDGRQLIDARFSGDGRSLLEVDQKGVKLLLSDKIN